MNRADGVARLAAEQFDVLVIGGGATGLGAALDAAARGYATALIEAADFAKATSSRSTKLVHGGVRYLQQGNVGLVREALRERTILRRNAPHLVDELAFVVPTYRWAETAYYGIGLKAYDLLAGRSGFAPSRIVSARAARTLIPGLRGDGLHGGVVYSDGRFDDARLAVALARTAVDRGAALANYIRAVRFRYEGTRAAGVEALDRETGRTFSINARVVINATGIFADELRKLDEPDASPLLAHSRGSHIVVRAAALAGPEVGGAGETASPGATGGTASQAAALLVPKTSDGRVLFAIPWHDRVIIGTTDVATDEVSLDPVASSAEVANILETVNRYLAEPLAEDDILATFAGLRPLIGRRAAATAKLSREHLIDVSASGVVTIAGGKWTTYRKMGEDVVNEASARADLPRRASPTARIALRGATSDPPDDESLRVYGSDAGAVLALGAHDSAPRAQLHPRLPYTRAHVVYAARAEMARTVDDVLARRTRALFLDAAAARACAPSVAALLATELGRDQRWEQEQVAGFDRLARGALLGAPRAGG